MPETIPTPTASEAQRPIFTIPLSLNINASTVPHKDDEKTQRYRSKMVSGVREDMLCRSTVSVQDLLKKIFAISDDDIKAHGDVDLGVVPADVVKIFCSTPGIKLTELDLYAPFTSLCEKMSEKARYYLDGLGTKMYFRMRWINHHDYPVYARRQASEVLVSYSRRPDVLGVMCRLGDDLDRYLDLVAENGGLPLDELETEFRNDVESDTSTSTQGVDDEVLELETPLDSPHQLPSDSLVETDSISDFAGLGDRLALDGRWGTAFVPNASYNRSRQKFQSEPLPSRLPVIPSFTPSPRASGSRTKQLQEQKAKGRPSKKRRRPPKIQWLQLGSVFELKLFLPSDEALFEQIGGSDKTTPTRTISPAHATRINKRRNDAVDVGELEATAAAGADGRATKRRRSSSYDVDDQLGVYYTELISNTVLRTNCVLCSMTGSFLRLYHFDPEGSLLSEAVDIQTEAGLKLFKSFMICLQGATPEQMGRYHFLDKINPELPNQLLPFELSCPLSTSSSEPHPRPFGSKSKSSSSTPRNHASFTLPTSCFNADVYPNITLPRAKLALESTSSTVRFFIRDDAEKRDICAAVNFDYSQPKHSSTSSKAKKSRCSRKSIHERTHFIHFRRFGARGRITTVLHIYLATSVDHDGIELGSEDMVVKVTWQHLKRACEAEIIRHSRERILDRIRSLDFAALEEEARFHKAAPEGTPLPPLLTLLQRYIDALDSLPDLIGSFESNKLSDGLRGMLPPHIGFPEVARATPNETVIASQQHPTTAKANDRQLRGVILARCQTLCYMEDDANYHRQYVRLVQSYIDIYEFTKVLHRDISLGNLMYKQAPTIYLGLTPDGKAIQISLPDRLGLISDFDLAVDEHCPPQTDHCGEEVTCTWPFAARARLAHPMTHVHQLIYDFESFLWVYFFTRARFRNGNCEKLHHATALLSTSLESLKIAKGSYFSTPRTFMETCQALFSQGLSVDYCLALYEVVRAFDNAEWDALQENRRNKQASVSPLPIPLVRFEPDRIRSELLRRLPDTDEGGKIRDIPVDDMLAIMRFIVKPKMAT